MWKKEDSKPQGVAENSTTSANPAATTSGSPASTYPTSGALPISPRAAACISQGIRIKGEVTGSEDLFVDHPEFDIPAIALRELLENEWLLVPLPSECS